MHEIGKQLPEAEKLAYTQPPSDCSASHLHDIFMKCLMITRKTAENPQVLLNLDYHAFLEYIIYKLTVKKTFTKIYIINHLLNL